MKNSKAWKWCIIAFVVAVNVLLIGNKIFGAPSTVTRKQDTVAAQRLSVPVGGVDERMALPDPVLVAGNAVVEPREQETKVAAAVPGRIAAIAVQEGDRVKAGSIIVEMEDAPERAAFQAAQVDYEKSLHGQRKDDVDAVISEAESARAKAELSAEAYRRTDQAAKGGAATADELDRAKSQAESDRRTFEATEARQRAAVSGSRWEDIAASKARRDQAKALLDRLAVRAPIEGEILQVKYRVGEYVTPGGNPLVVIGDTRMLRMRIDIDERDIGHIAIGDPAYAVADAYPDRKFPGKVVAIGRRMGRKNIRTDDPTERLDTKILETVVELSDSNGLVPGLRVTGYIGGKR